MLAIGLTLFSCDSAKSGAGSRLDESLDKIHSLTSDLYLGNGLVITSNDIYSTEFTSGARSRGLAVVRRTELPAIPGLNEAPRTFSYTPTHVHDDPRIPISAPNSQFYIWQGPGGRIEVRIGSNQETRPPGPMVYRLQSEIEGAATKTDLRTEVLVPLVVPHWSIAIDALTARLHLMREIDPNAISVRAVHTRMEGGKVETVVDGNAAAKIELEEGGGRRPVLLVVTREPVEAGEGLYLVASWPSP